MSQIHPVECLTDGHESLVDALRVDDLQFQVVTSPGPWLDACCEHLAAEFDPDVLDPPERLAEWLREQERGAADSPLVIVAAYFEHAGRALLAGVLEGHVMPIPAPPDAGAAAAGQSAIFAIGHQSTVGVLRRRGVGTALWNRSIDEACRAAAARGLRLDWSVLEGEAESLGFWNALGYLWPEGVRYWQPPLEFDAAGNPVHGEVAETLLLRSHAEPAPRQIDAGLLRTIVATIYRNWFIEPACRALSDEAQPRAQRYVMEIFDRVVESFAGRSALTLVQRRMEVIRDEVRTSFEAIVAALAESEYERCAKASADFLHHFENDTSAQPLLPYARYFAATSSAYRIWEVSYAYRVICDGFELAADLLDEGLRKCFPEKLPAEHAVLADLLRQISRMHCEYTRSENAFVTNDPWAMAGHARQAVEIDHRILDGLRGLPSELPEPLAAVAGWLVDYVEANRLLADGWRANAEVYAEMLDTRGYIPRYHDRIAQAKDNLQRLRRTDYSDLCSELACHLGVVERHQERLRRKGDTLSRLAITQGVLVLSLSGMCEDRSLLSTVVDDPAELRKFERYTRRTFRPGFAPRNFRPNVVQDIFTTSIGKKLLQSVSFDLPPVEVRMFNGRTYRFDTEVVLSNFGVCTVLFRFEISPEDDDAEDNGEEGAAASQLTGLCIEELRALMTLVCPHTGDVEIEAAPWPDENESTAASGQYWPEGFMDRVDLRGLRELLQDIPGGLPDGEAVRSARKVVEAYTEAVGSGETTSMDRNQWTLPSLVEERGAEGRPRAAGSSRDAEAQLADACGRLRAAFEAVSDDGRVRRLDAVADPHVRLADLAAEYLRRLECALDQYHRDRADGSPARLADGESLRAYGRRIAEHPEQRRLRLDANTGWFTYTCAGEIREYFAAGSPRRIDNFEEIAGHDDACGLILDQHESKAGFDDWRFVPFDISGRANLALTRSFESDAFYGSEAQAFLFFPDQPEYLVEQYEQAVYLMLRLNTVLKGFSQLTEEMTVDLRVELEAHERESKRQDRAAIERRRRKIEGQMDAILRFRFRAYELRDLLTKVGLSRYKDHGVLMKHIVEMMGLEEVGKLLDRHLEHLGEIQERLVNDLKETERALREKYEKWLARIALLLTILAGVGAAKDIAEVLLPTSAYTVAERIATYLPSTVMHGTPNQEGTLKAVLTFVVLLGVVIFVGFLSVGMLGGFFARSARYTGAWCRNRGKRLAGLFRRRRAGRDDQG